MTYDKQHFMEMVKKVTINQFIDSFERWYDRMPDEACTEVYHLVNGYHLTKSEHDMAMNYLKDEYGSSMPWTLADCVELLKGMGYLADEHMAIANQKFNVYDTNFLATRFKLRFKSVPVEAKTAIMYAIDDLRFNCEKAYEEYKLLKELYN